MRKGRAGILTKQSGWGASPIAVLRIALNSHSDKTLMYTLGSNNSRRKSRKRHMAGFTCVNSFIPYSNSWGRYYWNLTSRGNWGTGKWSNLLRGRIANKWPNFREVHLYTCPSERLLNTVKRSLAKKEDPTQLTFLPRSQRVKLFSSFLGVRPVKENRRWMNGFLKVCFQDKPMISETF